jgi:hypothetical protein
VPLGWARNEASHKEIHDFLPRFTFHVLRGDTADN